MIKTAIVIGAGPAGMIACGTLAKHIEKVILIEKNKIKIVSTQNQQKHSMMISRKRRHYKAMGYEAKQIEAENKIKRERQKENFVQLPINTKMEIIAKNPSLVPVEWLQLGLRAYHKLKEQNINNVQEIVDFYISNNGNLQVIKSLGSSGEKDIIDRLAEHGVYLQKFMPSRQDFIDALHNNPDRVLIRNMQFKPRLYAYLLSRGFKTVQDLMENPIDINDIKFLGRSYQQNLLSKEHEFNIDIVKHASQIVVK